MFHRPDVNSGAVSSLSERQAKTSLSYRDVRSLARTRRSCQFEKHVPPPGEHTRHDERAGNQGFPSTVSFDETLVTSRVTLSVEFNRLYIYSLQRISFIELVSRTSVIPCCTDSRSFVCFLWFLASKCLIFYSSNDILGRAEKSNDNSLWLSLVLRSR